MTAPIVPGTLIQDRYYVLRVVRPLEFGWLYSVADRLPAPITRQSSAHPLTCFLEEHILSNATPHPSLITRQLNTELTHLQRSFHHSSILNSQFQTDLPDYGEVLFDHGEGLEPDRVWISQRYGDHFSYAQVLEDRVLSGEGQAVLSEAEAWELLEALEPLLAALHRQGLSHRNLSPDSIVWQMAAQRPGLMQFGCVRSVLQNQARSIHPLDYVRSVHDCPIQADRVNLAETVLILLGDPSWNDLSLQLAQRLRPLLETPPQSEPLRPEASKKTKHTSLKSIVAPVITSYFSSPTAASTISSSSSSRSIPNQFNSSKRPQRSDQSIRSQRPKSSSSSSHRRRSPRSDRKSSIPSFKQDPILWAMGFVIFGLSMVFAYRLLMARLKLPNAESNVISNTISNSDPNSSSSEPFSFPLTTAPKSSELTPELQTQLRSLQLSEPWFVGTTAELLKNESMTTDDSRWKDAAGNLIKVLEPMTPEVRQGLGNYRRSDFDSWLSAKNIQSKPNILKQIETQTDQQFFEKFPNIKGQSLNPRQLGQVWYAIAREVIKNQKT